MSASTSTPSYDLIVVGAGIAGSALAHALSTVRKPSQGPLRVLLIERSLAQPDRIVGELLQPGGVHSLEKLGMEQALEGIDAVPAYGYCVIDEDGKTVHIPYPSTEQGRSFHHGRFIMKLREHAIKAESVDVLEGTVTGLVESATGRVEGVRVSVEKQETVYRAPLTIVADGCFSNLRSAVLGSNLVKSVTKSYFVGLILEDAKLPIPKHGTVVFVKGFGPVLLYQISNSGGTNGSEETRLLIDVKGPLPENLNQHLEQDIIPRLPYMLQEPILKAIQSNRLRRMPNSFLPPSPQETKDGVILVGDAWNMRHPLTGGGMTVALHDAVLLRDLISEVLANGGDLADWATVRKQVLDRWWWKRKPLSSTINILAVALYDLFGGHDEYLATIRRGCFKYFERGGKCVEEPVSMLAGIAPSPWLLFYHFFSVALYTIYILFTRPQSTTTEKGTTLVKPSIAQWPGLAIMSVKVFWTACIVFGPLMWSEIRWWGPNSHAPSRMVLSLVLAVSGCVYLASTSGVVRGLFSSLA